MNLHTQVHVTLCACYTVSQHVHGASDTKAYYACESPKGNMSIDFLMDKKKCQRVIGQICR